jgi:Kef-type K+ transport system membrane component KefB
MLSRGLIQTRDLKYILLLTVFIEFSLSCFYGWRQLYFWIVLFLWSMLMYREFCVASWLNVRKGIYLASHQIIIPLLGVYAANIAEQISFRAFSLLIFSIPVLSLTLTYELSRKTNPMDDESYTVIWGVKKTVFSALAVAGTGVVILLYLYSLAGVHWSFRVMVTGAFFLFFVTELSFLFKPCSKRAKTLKISGALYMLTLFTLIIMAYQ